MKLSSILRSGVAASALGLSVASGAAWAEIIGGDGQHVDSYGTMALTRYRDTLVFNAPTTTATRIDTYSTRILGKLSTGGTLLDQTFALPYSDPTVQAGVMQARAAITASGGPGVVIGSPTLTSRTVSLVSRTSTSQFTLDHSTQTLSSEVVVGQGFTRETAEITIADGGHQLDPVRPGDINAGSIIRAVQGGASGPCTAAIAALPSGSRPVCGPDLGVQVPIYSGQVSATIVTNTTYFVNEAISTTETWLTAEEYTLTGTVQPVGGGNEKCKLGAFSRNSIFMHGFSKKGGGFGYGGGWGGGGWHVTSTDGRAMVWGDRQDAPRREFPGLRADDISPFAGVSAGLSFKLTDAVTARASARSSRRPVRRPAPWS